MRQEPPLTREPLPHTEYIGDQHPELKQFDPVERPVHYNMGGIECIDYIKQVLGLDGYIAYCHGNFVKYQHRYRYKANPVEDMKKAGWYLNKMNEALAEKHK
jgi:hypothetical protein|tara:strand:+ start:1004 stop:1309 length:306 start_codon:yes stop_codon:yes gene_type:complete